MTELNITPLLDLVFVLLVIFIITTPQLVNNLEMTLPSGKPPPPNKVKPKITRIEVDAASHITLNGEAVTVTQLREHLAALKAENPDLPWWSKARMRSNSRAWSPFLTRCNNLKSPKSASPRNDKLLWIKRELAGTADGIERRGTPDLPVLVTAAKDVCPAQHRGSSTRTQFGGGLADQPVYLIGAFLHFKDFFASQSQSGKAHVLVVGDHLLGST